VVFDGFLNFLSWAMWIAAAAMAVSGRLRGAASRYLDEMGNLAGKKGTSWLLSASGALFVLYAYLKYCGYRDFQLPLDTANYAHMAHNFLHGWGFKTAIFGTNNFVIHFQPFIAFYSLLLSVWNHTMAIIVFHAATTASIPAAVYLLARRRNASELAATAAFIITATSPFLFEVAGATTQTSIHLPAFFLWGLYLLESGRKKAAGVLFLLALSTSEQAPIAFFGLGLYRAMESGRYNRKALQEGVLVCAASVVIFLFEMKVMFPLQPEARVRTWEGMYGHLGSSPIASIENLLFHPLNFASAFLWPFERFAPLFKTILSTGLLCLFVPATAVVWLLNFGPNFLSGTGSAFHTSGLHYAAQAGGPFWWAAAVGVAAAHRMLARRGVQTWILVWALAMGGLNLRNSPRILFRDSSQTLFEEGPSLLAKVPPQASLWVYEMVAPWLATRRFLKTMPYVLESGFQRELFLPDYILLSKAWVAVADTDFSCNILTVMEREGYSQAEESHDLILFRHPIVPLSRAGRPPSLTLLPCATKVATERSRILNLLAVSYLSERLDKHRQSASSFIHLGNAYAGIGKHDEAKKQFEMALRLDPQSVVAKNNLGNALIRSGDYSEAAAYLLSALKDRPKDSLVLFNLGNTLLLRGRLTDAVSRYKEAIKIRPELAKAHSNLGVTYFKLKRLDKALVASERAVELNPENLEFRRNLDVVKKARR